MEQPRRAPARQAPLGDPRQDLDLALWRAGDVLLHEHPRRVADEDLPWPAVRLEARREVHLPPDGRVVHSPLRAEVPDARLPSVDPDPYLEGLLEAVPQPLLAKRLHPVLHLDRHLHGPDRVVAVVRHRPQVAAGADGIAPRYSRVRTPRACMSRVLNFMHRTYCPWLLLADGPSASAVVGGGAPGDGAASKSLKHGVAGGIRPRPSGPGQGR